MLIYRTIFIFLFFVNAASFTCHSNQQDLLQEKLYKAIMNDSSEEIKLVIKSGAKVDFVKDNKSPLILAILLKRSNSIDCLLECGAKVNIQLIEYAVKARDSKIAAIIANKCKADLNATYAGYTLIQLAMGCCDYKTVIWLIKNGANFNDEFISQSTGGWGYGYPQDGSILLELIQTLIIYGYPVNNLWNEPIWGNFWLSFNDQIISEAIVQLLIKNGANPNYIFYLDRDKKIFSTPLMKAITYSNLGAVKVLLNSNVNVNQQACDYNYIRSFNLYTPLSYAIEKRSVIGDRNCVFDTIIKLLLEHKAGL